MVQDRPSASLCALQLFPFHLIFWICLLNCQSGQPVHCCSSIMCVHVHGCMCMCACEFSMCWVYIFVFSPWWVVRPGRNMFSNKKQIHFLPFLWGALEFKAEVTLPTWIPEIVATAARFQEETPEYLWQMFSQWQDIVQVGIVSANPRHTIKGRALHLGLEALTTINNNTGVCLFPHISCAKSRAKHVLWIPQFFWNSCHIWWTRNLTVLSWGKKMGRKRELTFVDSSSVRYLANDDNNNDDGNYFTYWALTKCQMQCQALDMKYLTLQHPLVQVLLWATVYTWGEWSVETVRDLPRVKNNRDGIKDK